MTIDPMTIDPITTEVVVSRLREVAAVMEHALYHSGYSPILRESRDGTAGLTDAQGRVLIVGGGLQYHALPYQQAVDCVVERFGRDGLRDGDSFIVNDPYLCGNPHVPDMVAVTPAFHRGELVGFGVSIAHKADVGGLVPGSSSAASREIFHDGLRLPPVRYETAAGIDPAIEDIIRGNSRTADIVIGDLRGQVGATRLGAARLVALCEEYGRDCVLAVMASVLRLTARRLAAELAGWPDGSATADGLLDHDGADRERPVRIAVRVAKEGERLVIDLSECAPQTSGPVNVNAWTTKAVSLLAVLAAADPSIPVNSGLLDQVAFVLPEGLVVNPRFPASVSLYFPTAVMVYTCVLSALGKLNPARAVAPSGMVTGAIALGYRSGRGGKPTVQYELASTGLGGTSKGDGTSLVSPMNHFTPGLPVEIMETEYPVIVRRYDMWRDSAGAGRQRGGVGYLRELELLEDCVLTLRSSGHRFPSWGLAGGQSPAISRTTINPGGADPERIGPIDTCHLKKGSVLRIERSGGGGYGAPAERLPEAVLDDVRNGYVSVAMARDIYGVVIDAQTMAIDPAATTARRREMDMKTR
jgi:N-methylhydantoinase B